MVVIVIKDWNVMELVCICFNSIDDGTDCSQFCFIAVFPENCDSFNGPHSIDCLITIWEEVGCKVKGLRYPGDLSSEDLNIFKNLDLGGVRANMEIEKSAADGGNTDNQLNCYGIGKFLRL
ncbi:uncharacterized protein LOC144745388 [Ciona intestinalis]